MMHRMAASVAGAMMIGAMTIGAAGAQQANPMGRGELIAYTCSGCHGHDFNGVGGIPLIRGRDAQEITTKMLEFRSGQRYSTVMRRLSLGMSEDDLRAVSTYLASLR